MDHPRRLAVHNVRSRYGVYTTGPRRPMIRLIMKNTRNKKNTVLAMPAAVPAIPPKPRAAAISAITKNVKAQDNMIETLS